jgi:hypothetical protein
LPFLNLVTILVHTCLKRGRFEGLCDGVKCRSLGLHSDMRIVLQHLPAHVPRDCHDGLLAGLPFGQFGYAGMPEIMESQAS